MQEGQGPPGVPRRGAWPVPGPPASLIPDAIMEFEKDLQTYLVLVEFTRSFDETPEVHKRKIAEKRQAYQGAMQHLQSQRPGCIVMQQTY
eukprot:185203-Rhodomonas_salina.1